MNSYGRFRDRYLTGPIDDYLYTVSSSGVEGQLGPWTIEYDYEMIRDVVTPNFAEAIASGKIVNNPCSYGHDIRTQESYPGTYWLNHPTYYNPATMSGPVNEFFSDLSGWSNETSTGGPPDPSDIEGRAKLVAIAKIDATPYAFGEDLGEIGETIRFLRNPLGSLFNLSKTFRSAVKRKQLLGMDHAKAIADVWLSYRFAASPLVRSISDLLEAQDLKVPEEPPRLTSHGRDEVMGDGETTSTRTTSAFTMTRQVATSTVVEGHASILYTVSNPIRDWRWRYGLRGKDLPATLWQLMPLSFMVDRLLDVSSFIQAVTNLADPRVSIVAASYTNRTEMTSVSSMTAEAHGSYTIVFNANKITTKNFSYDRVTWTPTLSDVIPDFTPGYVVDDATKIADLVSLIIANFR